MKLIGMFLYSFLLIVGGMFLLMKPEAYQRWIVKTYARKPSLARINPFLTWMQSPGYLIAVRAVGIVCLVMGTLLAIWACGEALR
jgi:hypothetical protein